MPIPRIARIAHTVVAPCDVDARRVLGAVVRPFLALIRIDGVDTPVDAWDGGEGAPVGAVAHNQFPRSRREWDCEDALAPRPLTGRIGPT